MSVAWKATLGKDAQAFMGRLNGVEARLDKAAESASKKMAEKYKKALVSGIRRQSFAVAPVSKSWATYKARNGLSASALQATGGYARSIDTVKVGKKWGVTVKGVSKLTGVPYLTVARWLENGTRKMPPRPHWGPALKTISKDMSAIGKEVAGVVFAGR